MEDRLKIQLTIKDKKAVELYKSISAKQKSRAVETALLLLNKNKTYKDIFFEKKENEDITHKQKETKTKSNSAEDKNITYSDWR